RCWTRVPLLFGLRDRVPLLLSGAVTPRQLAGCLDRDGHRRCASRRQLHLGSNDCLVMRGKGIGMRELLARCGALLCLVVGVGFLATGVAGALLLAGVPDGPLDLSHTGVPILVSVGVISSAALIVLLSRRGGERTPRPVRAFAVALDGAWAAVRRPSWRLLGA